MGHVYSASLAFRSLYADAMRHATGRPDARPTSTASWAQMHPDVVVLDQPTAAQFCAACSAQAALYATDGRPREVHIARGEAFTTDEVGVVVVYDAPATSYPAADQYGIVRLYVDPDGDDDALGDAAHPLLTGQEAADRMARWCALGRDEDCFVVLPAGHLAELIDFRPLAPPRRRVGFLGSRDEMTIEDSGVVTSGAPATLVCAGKDWTPNQWCECWLRIRTAGGTELALPQIKSNTTDTITTMSGWSFAPEAGMLFEIVSPVTTVDAIHAVLPWQSAADMGCAILPERRQPRFDLAYLQVGPYVNVYPSAAYSRAGYALNIKGGVCALSCVKLVADSGAGNTQATSLVENCTLLIGGLLPYSETDHVYDCEASDWDWMSLAGIVLHATRLAAYSTVVYAQGGISLNSGEYYGFSRSFAFVSGGTFMRWESCMYAQAQAGLWVGCWDVGFGDTARNVVADLSSWFAFRSKDNSTCGFGFIDSGDVRVNLILVDQHAHARVENIVALPDASIPVGIACTRGSLVAVAQGCSFAADVELQVDGVGGTFDALQVGTPLLGANLSNIIRDTE